MPIDQDMKDFISANFQRLEEKMDHYNSVHVENIARLKENDRQHFSLDREHRETCALNREHLKADIDSTLSRFGERLGFIERYEGKIEMIEHNFDELSKRMDKNYEAILEKLEKRSESVGDWMKTLLPYIIILGYLAISAMGGM